MLASIPTTYRPQPAQRAYQPHGAALALLYDRAPEVLLSGPAGTGKSRACLEKLHICATKYARMRGLIVRKTRESLSEAALVTYEDKVLPEGSRIAEGPRRNFRQVYTYPNRSQLIVGGLDKASKIMSTEYDVIYVQEAIELELADWLALTTRLRNSIMPYQQIIADCNPDSPMHWLWQRTQSGMTALHHSRHEDNPRLFRGGVLTEEGRVYIERLDRLGHYNPDTDRIEGTEYARLRLGQWVQASGLVYDVWSDGPSDGNVTEEAEYIEDGGSIYWACDDGYAGERDARTGHFSADSHPRVFLLVQERGDGRLCVFWEDYRVKALADRHIADVAALPYPAPDYVALDSSAAELRGRLQQAGHYTRGKPARVDESIKATRRMLAPDMNGVRRILVHPRCKHLRAELASYRYDPQTESPVKQWDHGPDALRYLAWTKRLEG
jgi:phage terminase large subunit